MVIMGVGIDEARRDDLSAGFESNGRLRLRQVADSGDQAIADTDIRIEARLACPVDDRSAANEDIERMARAVSYGELLSL